MGSLKQNSFTRIENLTFRVYTNEEIDKISVLQITNEVGLNSLGHCMDNGLYDLRLGPMVKSEGTCKTCSNRYYSCPGHTGHIDLPLAIYNPFFYDVIREILNRICPICMRFQVKGIRGIQFIYECLFLQAGYDLQSLNVAQMVSSFMADPDEAIEDGQSLISLEPKKKGTNVNILVALEKKLKRNFKQFVKENIPTKTSTCNTQSIYLNHLKTFLAECIPSAKGKCLHCQSSMLKIKVQNSNVIIRNNALNKEENANMEEAQASIVTDDQSSLTPLQARKMMRECFKKDGYILKHVYPFLANTTITHPTDMFFIEKLIVIPPKYRPCQQVNGIMTEAEMSYLYTCVLNLCKSLRFMTLYKDKEVSEVPELQRYLIREFKGETLVEKSHNVWHELQVVVDNILDAEISRGTFVKRGIRQRIEKKMGLFRRHLMGKRVDFSARSVAAPDPMLAVDEVGVPQDFAIKLSYPVPVTSWNVPKLRRLVQNGPDVYPGAVYIEDEEGKRINLKPDDAKQRDAIARSLLTPAESCVRRVNATKIVFRHLQDGDHVLMNRQPTLHKPSIQAHRAHIMPKDRVLRLPYANCKAYNADFDGDELNLHFPQNEMARSESLHIVNTQHQYLTPKDGSPLAGLIQDCVVASVMLTTRGVFFDLEDYQQLVYSALSHCPGKLRLLHPAILRPQRLWSGKQIISTILLNLTPEGKAPPSFKFKTTVKVDNFQTHEPREWLAGGPPEAKKESMTECEFLLSEGELVCGVVDKCAIGSTSYGLVHTFYDLYGGLVASHVLTSVNRLCVAYLQWVGHTISLQEFVTSTSASKKRRKDLRKLIKSTELEVSKKLDIPMGSLSKHVEFLHKTENEKEMSVVDAAYTSVLGPTTSNITSVNEKSLVRNNLKNKMKMMIDTGAKGSKVNMNQMSSLFGSVAIDGKRMPLSIAGKSLPSVKPYDPDPRAGGYIPYRFVTGMDPKSFFFLCIVGRDSLQHTAVKTANSGYMQRCLIKHLEGIHVKYDMTVRNSDNAVLQFNYGEDSLDVSKVPFLRNVDTVDALVENYYRSMNKNAFEMAKSTQNQQVDKYKVLTKKYKKKTKRNRTSGFLKFCSEEQQNAKNNNNYAESGVKDVEGKRPTSVPGRSVETLRLLKKWQDFDEERRAAYSSATTKINRGRNPVSSVFSGSQFGVVSEALDDLIDEYYTEKYSQKKQRSEQTLDKKEVSDIFYMKALMSRVEPGEAVGALCAQAIGEPLTQMTLNTFHFAGRDELNVTLGVPRMIEILRTASENIATPIMEVPFRPGVPPALAEKLRKKLTPVPLEKVLHKVNVSTCLQKTTRFYRETEILFTFLEHKEYKQMFFIRPEEVLEYMEKCFFKKVLLKNIKAAINKVNLYAATVRQEKKDGEEEGEDQLTVMTKRGLEEDDDEDSDKEEGEDDDADKDLYDEEEDDKEGEGEEEEAGKEQEVKAEGEEEEEGEGDRKSVKKVKAESKNAPKMAIKDYIRRKDIVTSSDGWIKSYDFDRESSLWCKVTLDLPIAEGRYDLASILQTASKTSQVHCVRNIKKAYVVPKDDYLLLRTEGVNIHKIYAFENVLDINRLYTNNIHFMVQRYGIEAGQRTIIKEIKEVQSAYDIKVDFRHLSLLADYFTCEGVYKACSRFALNTCASPIQKMSYETCFHFLKKALLQATPDEMSSPSSSVMVGQPVRIGTNSMDILMKLAPQPA